MFSNIFRRSVNKHAKLLNKKLSNTMSIFTMKYSQLIELKSQHTFELIKFMTQELGLILLAYK
jgi:hypothetical protein